MRFDIAYMQQYIRRQSAWDASPRRGNNPRGSPANDSNGSPHAGVVQAPVGGSVGWASRRVAYFTIFFLPLWISTPWPC